MTPTRAAAYFGVVSLLAAWLASAAGVIGQPRASRVTPRTQSGGSTDAIEFDVHSQANRLRQRIASAPVPQQPARNPFTFMTRPVEAPRRQAARVAVPAPPPAPVVEYEPELTLIGVAEQKTPTGAVRTAMIAAAGDELLMVSAGQQFAGRYRVVAVGADAVELSDITTGRIRRLALR